MWIVPFVFANDGNSPPKKTFDYIINVYIKFF